MGALSRFIRRRVERPAAGFARRLINRADAARDDKCFHAAAMLYEEALRLRPANAAIQIQCGHMFKEAGDLASAQPHYLAAVRLTPDDPDLALQLGHFYKLAGRPAECETAYRRAIELQPEWEEPRRQLAALQGTMTAPLSDPAWQAPGAAFDIERLVPELIPRGGVPIPVAVNGVHIRRLGSRRERSRWGMLNTLRGVEALRGYCIDSVAITELRILAQDREIYRGPLKGIPLPQSLGGQLKYVFNIWLDFTSAPVGLQSITFRFIADAAEVRRHVEHVNVAAALAEAEFDGCDGVVELSSGNSGTPKEQINERPSVIRPARRRLLDKPIRNVLVLRTDQLGDLVTSIPAIFRLREILPDARIVGLLTAANVELARTMPLFDDIIVADFPDVEEERRRVMPLPVQEALRARLASYDFDIALDLAESAVSRPLLLLSGARLLYGFYDRDWPWLSAGFEGTTHDPRNNLEMAAQSTKVLGFIERLGAALFSRADVIPRLELRREALRRYGIEDGEEYAVLHTGARIRFSQWPRYGELASLILARTDLKIVLLTDDVALRHALPPGVRAAERFRLIDTRLPFDDFDALLSFCRVFVGNDSGPKHLAALRGAQVVSIHSSRINWNEWGQEMSGVIISRKVPCAGCAIFHDTDECGQDFACITHITAEEVLGAITALLDDACPVSPASLN